MEREPENPILSTEQNEIVVQLSRMLIKGARAPVDSLLDEAELPTSSEFEILVRKAQLLGLDKAVVKVVTWNNILQSEEIPVEQKDRLIDETGLTIELFFEGEF